jgi:hypothetical protein
LKCTHRAESVSARFEFITFIRTDVFVSKPLRFLDTFGYGDVERRDKFLKSGSTGNKLLILRID